MYVVLIWLMIGLSCSCILFTGGGKGNLCFFSIIRLVCRICRICRVCFSLLCELYVGYMLLFTFSVWFVLSVADLFSVRVFILAIGGYKVFCVGSRLVIPTLYRILSGRSCSVVFRLFIGCCRGLLFCAFPGGVFIRCL